MLGYGLLSGGAEQAAAPLPPDPPVVTVAMSEYRFDFGSIPEGRVVFEVVNEGQLAHRLSLIPLAEDFPPILEQLRGTERRVVDTLAAVATLAPGQRRSVAVDLAPGRYAFVCFVSDPDGSSHALKGHAAEFRVAGA
ncbi:MAG: cupredoxin domain-containing protein [Actinomycetota bacterium]|nr:cupredoxin domain-containing protein [Actinomycetota bacterium]